MIRTSIPTPTGPRDVGGEDVESMNSPQLLSAAIHATLSEDDLPPNDAAIGNATVFFEALPVAPSSVRMYADGEGAVEAVMRTAEGSYMAVIGSGDTFDLRFIPRVLGRPLRYSASSPRAAARFFAVNLWPI